MRIHIIYGYNVQKAYKEQFHHMENPLIKLSSFEGEVLRMISHENTIREIAEPKAELQDEVRATII